MHRNELETIKETRIVCPICNMGFVEMKDEFENTLTFPSQQRVLYIPTSHPTCMNVECRSKFIVTIDKTLKITLKKIKY